MSNNREKDYYKDLEYKTHYADGVILQCDGFSARLVFFEEELNIRENGRPDIDKDNRKLLFEVRLPYISLLSLKDNIDLLRTWMDTAFSIGKQGADSKSKQSWVNFNNKLKDVILNTGEQMSDKDHTELTELFTELLGRVKKSMEEDKNGK